MTSLKPGDMMHGYCDTRHILPTPWRGIGGLDTGWLHAIARHIIEHLQADGIDPATPIEAEGRDLGYHHLDWGRNTFAWRLIAVSEPVPAARRFQVDTEAGVRAFCDADRQAHGCTCPDVPVRLIPTTRPGYYSVQQLHDRGCPMLTSSNRAPGLISN